jgi:hypothetical protein
MNRKKYFVHNSKIHIVILDASGLADAKLFDVLGGYNMIIFQSVHSCH